MAMGKFFPFSARSSWAAMEAMDNLSTFPEEKRNLVVDYWGAWIKAEMFYRIELGVEDPKFTEALKAEAKLREQLQQANMADFINF